VTLPRTYSPVRAVRGPHRDEIELVGGGVLGDHFSWIALNNGRHHGYAAVLGHRRGVGNDVVSLSLEYVDDVVAEAREARLVRVGNVEQVNGRLPIVGDVEYVLEGGRRGIAPVGWDEDTSGHGGAFGMDPLISCW